VNDSTLTMNDLRDRAERPLVATDQLFVILQGDRPLEGSSRHALANVDVVVIGRGDRRSAVRKCAGREQVLELRFPDPRMSSTHARLWRGPNGYVLEDAGSKNGSRVDGHGVSRAALHDGSVIELGLTTLLLRTGLPSLPEGDEDLRLAPTGTPLGTLLPGVARELDRLSRVARSGEPVMLLGETGTGKELTARAVHALSGRSGPLVAVNCAAIPGALVEATLFGHKRGAYSDAVADNIGLVRSAHGGTLMLDEVGDLPLPAQGAVLRMLQEGEVLPVGASRPVEVDVRIVSATHQPMARLVAEGRIREDFYARLSGFVVTLPALRERREDMGLLLGSLLSRERTPEARHATLAPGTMAALLRHDWPRNVRELDKWLWRSLALHDDGVLRGDCIEASEASGTRPAAADAGESPRRPTRDTDTLRDEVESALLAHRGNLAAVASSFRTSRSQVHRWLKRFGLSAHDFRS
jgi:transcriptional regulator with AAA-type ATPase domain